jgi:hypothetical protein
VSDTSDIDIRRRELRRATANCFAGFDASRASRRRAAHIVNPLSMGGYRPNALPLPGVREVRRLSHSAAGVAWAIPRVARVAGDQPGDSRPLKVEATGGATRFAKPAKPAKPRRPRSIFFGWKLVRRTVVEGKATEVVVDVSDAAHIDIRRRELRRATANCFAGFDASRASRRRAAHRGKWLSCESMR